MRDAFFELVDDLTGRLRGDETLLANFSGEESDFVRFNRSAVRQPGRVRQRFLELELIRGSRHVAGYRSLSGKVSVDRETARALVDEIRDRLPQLPEDPYLLYNTEPTNTEQAGEDRLPSAGEIAEAVLAAGDGMDLVGILAAGGVLRGFANSLGQRNWFSTHSFHVDWCFYHAADKAVKASHAGFEWVPDAFGGKVAEARRRYDLLARPPRTIEPGEYRVYLAPPALDEMVGMLGWGGFGLKARRTKTTSLLKMTEHGRTLADAVTLRENTAEGIAPNFQDQGFVRPDSVVLIQAGRLGDPLVSPRSAREYDVPTNGAEAHEAPVSLDMAAGDVPTGEVLSRLDTGVCVSRLWYLNYSDRPACRMTGMTRFATFWVEGGRIVAPVNVMRFDETIYRVLGENLIGLTDGREFIPSSSTYFARSTDSSRMPGALVEDFRFTL